MKRGAVITLFMYYARWLLYGIYISFSPQRCSSLHSDMFNSSFTFLVFILLISKDITDNKKEKFFSISFVIAHTYSQKK